MIRMKAINEKVSKEEKQSVLEHPGIHIGMEFEIESEIAGSQDVNYPDELQSPMNYVQYRASNDYFREDTYVEIGKDDVLDNMWKGRQAIDEFERALDDYPNIKEKIIEYQDIEGDDFSVDTVYARVDEMVDMLTPGQEGLSIDVPLLLEEVRNFIGVPFETTEDYEVLVIGKNRIENDYSIVEEKDAEKPITVSEFQTFLSRMESEYEDALIEYQGYFGVSGSDNSEVVAELEDIVGSEIEVFEDYHEGKNSPGWRVEPDSSLATENGFELITPKDGLPLQEALKVMRGVFKYIDETDGLYTSDSTGFHVNISIEGVNLRKQLDTLKLALFMEEGKVFKYFQSRENNQYTKSVLRALRDPTFSVEKTFKGMKDKEYSEIVSDIKDKLVPVKKYFGINLEKLSKNYIEFRYIGGANYHQKYGAVRRQILDYGFFMLVATDPTFKRREYIKKVNRIIQSLEEKEQSEEKVDDIKDEFKNITYQIAGAESMSATNQALVQSIDDFDAVFKEMEEIKDTFPVENTFRRTIQINIGKVLRKYKLAYQDGNIDYPNLVSILSKFVDRVRSKSSFSAWKTFKEMWDLLHDTTLYDIIKTQEEVESITFNLE